MPNSVQKQVEDVSEIRPACGEGDISSFTKSISWVQIDEYTCDDDPGFELYEVAEKDLAQVSKQLASKFDFPKRACTPSKKSN